VFSHVVFLQKMQELHPFAAAGTLVSIFGLTAAVGPTSCWFSSLNKSKSAEHTALHLHLA
jgi:hypothetical protein